MQNLKTVGTVERERERERERELYSSKIIKIAKGQSKALNCDRKIKQAIFA